jgi:hypothetical protein
MELQHVNVKIFVEHEGAVDPERFLGVFHRWIRDKVLDELLIDVADYRHVPDGPGILLAGHDAIYSLDHTDGRWGLRYNRRTVLDGSNQDRLRQAFQAAAWACALLEEELRDEAIGTVPVGDSPRFNIRFSRTEFELFVNDRGLAPNTAESFAGCKAELEGFVRELLGSGDFELERHDGARFGVTIRLGESFALAAA